MSDRTRPRAVRRCLLALLILGVGVIAWLASRDQSDLAALRGDGATASATVTSRHTRSGRSTTYHLDYTFTAAGVADGDDVSPSLYQATDVGGSLQVTYLPSHPQTHRVGPVTAAQIADDRQGWALLLSLGVVIWGILYAVVPFYVK